MYVVVTGIVPHAAAAELHRVRVGRLLEVAVRVALDVPATADEPADQADPQVLSCKTQQLTLFDFPAYNTHKPLFTIMRLM